MSNDVIDRAIRENFPLIAAPQSGQLLLPEKFGTRYIVAKDGLFREIYSPWLHATVPIARIAGMSSPYGEVMPGVKLTCNMPPQAVWREFLAQARSSMPDECAALIVWNAVTGAWRLAKRVAVTATPWRVDYQEPKLDGDEVGVIDIHSHGRLDAKFSKRDDADDHGGIKIAAVVGRVDTAQPEIALRLVCLDWMAPMRLKVDGTLEMKEVHP